MSPQCRDCQWLWNAYARAALDHIQLEDGLRAALLRGDLKHSSGLRPLVERAAGERAWSRRALMEHARAAHSAGAESELMPIDYPIRARATGASAGSTSGSN